jgi:hypothetical protein
MINIIFKNNIMILNLAIELPNTILLHEFLMIISLLKFDDGLNNFIAFFCVPWAEKC